MASNERLLIGKAGLRIAAATLAIGTAALTANLAGYYIEKDIGLMRTEIVSCLPPENTRFSATKIVVGLPSLNPASYARITLLNATQAFFDPHLQANNNIGYRVEATNSNPPDYPAIGGLNVYPDPLNQNGLFLDFRPLDPFDSTTPLRLAIIDRPTGTISTSEDNLQFFAAMFDKNGCPRSDSLVRLSPNFRSLEEVDLYGNPRRATPID